MKKYFFRFLPILIIAILMISAIIFGGFDFFSFENLKKYSDLIKSYHQNNPVLFPIIFILIYILSTALSIPGAVFLTMLSGFFFGKYFATLYVAFGATIGAAILFLAAKTAIKDYFIKKAGKLFNKISKEFQGNATCYLMFARLIPLFPFWLVNIIPAFFNIKFRTYLLTTFFGIMPGTFVFAQVGVGLDSILKQDQISLSSFFTFEVQLTLILLGLFSILPIIFKKIKKKIC